MGEDVGALESLLKVTEDVVDDDNSLGGVGGASNVFSNTVSITTRPANGSLLCHSRRSMVQS